jgi:hypothetical protein
MSAMSLKKPPVRHVLALSAAATLVATAAFALTAPVPSAQAKGSANRRLCMYVNGEHNADLKISRYVVVNYKKDGDCPTINSKTYPKLISYANPVPKSTCEDVSADVEFESKYTDNLCTGPLKQADKIYELIKPDGQRIDPAVGIHDLGWVRDFR